MNAVAPILKAANPIERELVKYALEAAADEMSLTVVRSAYSNTLRDVMDFSTALLTAEGEMIVQGLSLPLHLGAFPYAIRAVLTAFGEDLREGDVYALNDPYHGGMHLPDIFMFRPVFVGARLIGFAAVVGHQSDIGGRVPGGNACDSVEIYQEGLRIPPIRAVRADADNADFWNFIRLNVRVSEGVMGDLRAQIAGLKVGERQMRATAEKVGVEILEHYMRDLLRISETMARAEIATWPEGCYRFVDHLDDDGIDLGRPVRIEVALAIKEGGVSVSFDGTSPQVRGAINSSISSTVSAVMLAVRSVLPSDVPNNAGFFRTVTVEAAEGLVVNPRTPAPVAARALTCFRVVDAVMGALAQALPEQVFAAGDGGVTVVTAAGRRPDGSQFVLMDSIGSCWGGRPWADGIDAITPISLNISNIPAEVIEREYPIRVESHGLAPNSDGPGRHRGGLGQEKIYRFLVDETELYIRGDRHTHRPYGLAGGGPGEASETAFIQGGREREAPSKVSAVVSAGTGLRHRTAGGGGWGDPLDRDAARVLADVALGKLSRERARSQYGVVVGSSGGGHDDAATQVLRGAMRQARRAVRS